MNFAFVLALTTGTLNLATAVAQFTISRAPGWRSARTFGFIALTAALYSAANLVQSLDGLPDAMYLASARSNYFWAHLHVLAWFPFVFGGPNASLRACSRRVRAFVAVGVAIAVFFEVTGLHLTNHLYTLHVGWAHATYRYPVEAPIGDAYGTLLLLTLLAPYGALIGRLMRREPGAGQLVAGFTVFLACATIELLVANRVIATISPVDIGFLAVVAPTSQRLLRRFIDDARRLTELSGRLAGEVRERTEERDRAEQALLESERLAALGRLASGVGHEINNPLTYVNLSLGRVEVHLREASAPHEVREALADAIDGAHRIQKVVEGLGTYSRRHGDRGALDVREAARAALKVAGHQLRHVVRLETSLEPAPLALADEPRVVQAIVNLLANAAQAQAGRGGEARIIVRTGTTPDGQALIEVEDDGPGIPAEHLAHLAEPYYTTRSDVGGLGLGLFVTRGIVDAHGGRLEFDSAPGRGTRARITLPAAEAGAAGRATDSPAQSLEKLPGPAAAPAAGVRRRLLVVDDEPLVSRLLAQALGDEWDVTCAGDGAQALEWIERETFDAILCDLLMPGITGMDVAERVAERDPALRERMVFLTGGAVTLAAQAFVARPDVRHVAKPPDLLALKALLRGSDASRRAA